MNNHLNNYITLYKSKKLILSLTYLYFMLNTGKYYITFKRFEHNIYFEVITITEEL